MSLSDSQKYVLYIVPSDPHCTELMNKLTQEYSSILAKTHVQDIRALPARPPWLQFVPTLVERASKQMYAGNDVLDFIKGLPPEFSFDFVGGGGKKNKMSSVSSGAELSQVRLSSLKNSMSLDGEQKTELAAQPAPSVMAPQGSRAGDQQRREAETQRRIEEINTSRQASMPRTSPGLGSQLSHDRGFQIESMGPQNGVPQGGSMGSFGPQGFPQGFPQAFPPQQMYGQPAAQTQQMYGQPAAQTQAPLRYQPGNMQSSYGPPQGQAGYGPPQGQAGYGPPQGQAGYGPPQGQGGYGPPQGQGGPGRQGGFQSMY